MTDKQHDAPEDERKLEDEKERRKQNAEQLDPLGSGGPGFIPGEGF